MEKKNILGLLICFKYPGIESLCFRVRMCVYILVCISVHSSANVFQFPLDFPKSLSSNPVQDFDRIYIDIISMI